VDFFEMIIIIFVAYTNYILYQFWFESPKKGMPSDKQFYKRSDGYSFQEFATTVFNWLRAWITFDKIVAVFAEIFCIGILTLDLISLFTRQ
jgi:hypothetical protein